MKRILQSQPGFIAIVTFVVFLIYCVCNIDSNSKRRRYAAHIRELVQLAHADATNPKPVFEIIRIANENYDFGSVYAVTALKELPEFRELIIPEMVRQLSSDNRTRAREAAIGLTKIPATEPNDIRAIAAQVARPGPDDDVTWFSVGALAAAGAAAVDMLPLLRSKVHSGSDRLDEFLEQAIQVLATIEATGNAESP